MGERLSEEERGTVAEGTWFVPFKNRAGYLFDPFLIEMGSVSRTRPVRELLAGSANF
jgi:hypothetical protein